MLEGLAEVGQPPLLLLLDVSLLGRCLPVDVAVLYALLALVTYEEQLRDDAVERAPRDSSVEFEGRWDDLVQG